MTVNSIQTAFSAGEISPELYGEVDLRKLSAALTTCRNCVVNYRGGAMSRGGLALVGVSLQTLALANNTSTGPPRTITFQFSISQGYELEFGDHYIRFIFQGGYVLEDPVAVTGVTRATPGVVSVSGTPFADGDWVFASGFLGSMAGMNGQTFIVEGATSGSFQLYTLQQQPFSTTGFSAYSGGGEFSRLYTISSPYAASDLPYLKYAQSADVMSLTCSNPVAGTEYPPYDLTRNSATNWTLVETDFNSVINFPSSVTAASLAQAPSTGINATFSYAVTAVDKDGNESISSTPAECHGADLEVEAGTNVVTWSGVQNALTYNVYRAPPAVDTPSVGANPVPPGSIYGFVGSSFGVQFNDTISASDLTQTPPTHKNPFARGQILAVLVDTPGSGLAYGSLTFTVHTSTGHDWGGYVTIANGELGGVVTNVNGADYQPGDTITFSGSGTLPTASLDIGPDSGTYPGEVAYFQQRRFYACSLNDPDTFWTSQTGRYSNFDTAIPTVATDAITANPWTEQVNGLQWLIPMPGGLLAFTGQRAWQIVGEGSYALNVQPITPSTTQAQPQAFNGCSATIEPIVVDQDVIYVESVGATTVRDLSYNFFTSIYTGADLTLLSSHLFLYRELEWTCWARKPYKILWGSRDDGSFISLTYLKEQEVYGWARHDTNGLVLGLSSVTEPPVDAVYIVAQRFPPYAPNGIYTIERMDNRTWQTVEDAFAVDSAVSNPMVFPAATVRASATSGVATFFASAGVFSAASVGSILRMAGGIASVTGYVNATTAVGTWILNPVSGVMPLPYASSGTWSLAQPVTSLAAPHLAGMTVVGLADGVPIGPVVVPTNGVIPIGFSASNVKIGLGFVAQMQSPYANGQDVVQGSRKICPAVTLRMAASGTGFQVGTNQPDGAAQNPPSTGPAWSNLAAGNTLQSTGGQTPPPTYVSPGGQTVTQLWTGDIRVDGTDSVGWDSKGQVAVQQLLPLALEVTALMPEMLPGDLPEVTYQDRQRTPEEREKAPGPGRWMLSNSRARL